MRVHRQNRLAQDSVTEGHPNRERTSHRMASFATISPALWSYQLTGKSAAKVWDVGRERKESGGAVRAKGEWRRQSQSVLNSEHPIVVDARD